jgi:DNA modification methylase
VAKRPPVEPETPAVERVPLSALKPAEWNPRLLREKRFKDLCRSLQADPGMLERRPILAQSDGTIYAGNQRYRAAEHLGWTEVPAIVEDVPDQLAKERAIRDNIAAGDWQEDQLAEMLVELKLQDSDLEALGFDADQLNDLLELSGINGETAPAPDAQMDRAEELREKWGTERGQLWLIPSRSVPGREHRLLCGDSTSAEDVVRLMGGERAALMVTDPPYGVEYEPGHRDTATHTDRLIGDDRADWEAAYREFAGDVAYVWCAGLRLREVASSLEAAGFDIRTQIVWVKPYQQMSRGDYHWQHENCWYAVRRGKTSNWQGDRQQTSVWEATPPGDPYGRSEDDRASHPTQKPAALFVKAINNNTAAGAIAYDAFFGSGTAAVAAEQTGRLCYGCEIEPKYVAVALQRLADMGLEPRLA